MARGGGLELGDWKRLFKRAEAMDKGSKKFLKSCLDDHASQLSEKLAYRSQAGSSKFRKGWKIGRVRASSTGYQVDITNRNRYDDQLDKKAEELAVNSLIDRAASDLDRRIPIETGDRVQRFLDRLVR